MPSTPGLSGLRVDDASRARSPAGAWWREPLLHFALLGGLLFAADHLINAREDDPHVIRIDAAVDRQAREIFVASRGREPDATELAALRKAWLDNEVLYREGLALQVDRGDDAIRERVIFKALSLVDANVRLPAIDGKALRAWFEQRREKYDEPARYDFEEAVLPGSPSEDEVRAFVRALNGGTPGDAKAGLRVFRGRPESNLVQSYGEDFAKELCAGPTGEWRALHSRDGWRAVRLVGSSQGRSAQFEVVAPVVLQDWKDAAAAEQRSAAVRALARKYRVIDATGAR